MRLQKYMAKCGVASRRKSETMISDGLVQVNNKVVEQLGYIVDPQNDIVKVNGQVIKMETKKIYIMLNKPQGYVTSLKDEKNRKVVTDLIEGIEERIYPVGRLDMDTTGLLLLTNDGDLAFKLTHPSREIYKTYIAHVEGVPTVENLDRFRRGLEIDGKLTSRSKVKILKQSRVDSILEISIYEGRNRQVRKMCLAIGHPVKNLKRVTVGQIELKSLNIGQWRHLNNKEINYLNSLS